MDDTMGNIKYVQLEPSAFLTDLDFQLMTAEQRGVYCSIIFYLYCNGGEIQLPDNNDITLLYKQHHILASISGCHKGGEEWNTLWDKIKHKFNISGNTLSHKRVTEELERASNNLKQKSDAGKRA